MDILVNPYSALWGQALRSKNFGVYVKFNEGAYDIKSEKFMILFA